MIKIFKHLKNISYYIGKISAWCTLFMVCVLILIIILRYFFHSGSIALQEIVGYLHACLILCGMSYTYQKGKHVRIDILYDHFSKNTQKIIQFCCHFFIIIPVSFTLIYFTYDYAYQAWLIQEGSREAGGLPYLYLIKILLCLMPVMLCIEALCQTVLIFEGNL